MKTKWTLLLIGLVGGLNGMAPAALAQGGEPQPMLVHDVTGSLRIQQSLPATCDDVDQTTPVLNGRLEITPAEGLQVQGGKSWVLTQATVSFAAFTIHRKCVEQDVTRAYTELGVQLGGAVPFVASPSAPGVFDFSVPKDDVLLYEAAIVNGGLETGYRHPKEPVTGTIDLEHGTVQMRVVGASKVHVTVLGDYDGSLTATLFGSIAFPDADGDGVPDRGDNCLFGVNPDQSPVASPIVRAPADVTLASCADDRIGRAIAADICDDGPVTLTNDAPSPFTLGTTVVTWSAQDAKGRVGTSAQRVTVVDTTPPSFTFVPPDITMNDCGPADLGLPAALDDCAGTLAMRNDAPASFGVGPTVVTWTATDVSGNRATATQVVTVDDTRPPALSCVPGVNSSGKHVPSANNGDGFYQVFTSDACTLAPTIRLGGFTLLNGETIKITQTPGQPGVRVAGVMGPAAIKHFQVGPGDAVITSTDGSGNVTSVSCLVPPPPK